MNDGYLFLPLERVFMMGMTGTGIFGVTGTGTGTGISKIPIMNTHHESWYLHFLTEPYQSKRSIEFSIFQITVGFQISSEDSLGWWEAKKGKYPILSQQVEIQSNRSFVNSNCQYNSRLSAICHRPQRACRARGFSAKPEIFTVTNEID